MAPPDNPIEPALGAGWTVRVLVLCTVAVLTVLEVPADRRTTALVVVIAVPLLASTATAVAPAVLRRTWAPHPHTAIDAVLLSLLSITVPELRGALAILALGLFLAAMMRGRVTDLALGTSALAVALVATVRGPAPSPASIVAAVTVTGLAMAMRTQLMQRATLGRDHRIALLSGRSRAMLRGVAEALYVTRPDGVIVDANDASLTTTGSTNGLVGQSCAATFALETDAAPLDCQTCPLLAVPGQDVEVWRREGTERRTMIARAQPVLDRSGHVVEVLHSLRDVTEITRARDAQNVFLATASHELRTPLTVIRGSLDTVLQRANLPPEQRDVLLRAALTRSKELDAMITRLLDTSRVRDGAVDVSLHDVDLVQVVTPRVVSIDGASPDHEFSWTHPPDLPLVHCDAHSLGVVVDHLLENARKYQPDGGLIEVRVHVDERRVSLAVRDHGIGMTSEQQDRCFDRFWQADIGDRRRFGGSGVGLYLVRSLVEAMRAEIEVWSQVGRGSQFTVHLRRSDAPPEMPEPRLDTRRESMIDEFMAQVGVTRTGRTP